LAALTVRSEVFFFFLLSSFFLPPSFSFLSPPPPPSSSSFLHLLPPLFFFLKILLRSKNPEKNFFFLSFFSSQVFNVGIQALLAIFALLFFVVKLWRIKDGYHIKQELFAVLLGAPVLFIAFIICFGLGVIFADNFFLMAAPFYVIICTLVYPVVLSFTRISVADDPAENRILKRSLSLTPPTPEEVFKMCLADDEHFASFMKFSIESWCVENLLFYVNAEKFSVITDHEELLREAERLMSGFLVPDAPLEVNLDEAQRQLVIDRVRNADVDALLFKGCQDHVFKVMLHDTFPKWRRVRDASGEGEVSGSVSATGSVKGMQVEVAMEEGRL